MNRLAKGVPFIPLTGLFDRESVIMTLPHRGTELAIRVSAVTLPTRGTEVAMRVSVIPLFCTDRTAPVEIVSV